MAKIKTFHEISQDINGMPFDTCLDNLWMEVGNPFILPDNSVAYDVRSLNIHSNLVGPDWDNQAKVPELIVDTARDPAYLHFICKYILNLDLLPVQMSILNMFWHKPLPMLIATRGGGKTFLDAVYIVLRALLHQGCKICIVSASFRQAITVFNYVLQIWDSAPVLRDIVGKKNAPHKEQHACTWNCGLSKVSFLPLGDGCLTKDTFITLKDRFSSLSNFIKIEDLNTDHQSMLENNSILSKDGFQASNEKFYNGIRPIKSITTRRGYNIKGTYNHKIQIIRNNKLEWVRLDEIVENDYAPINRQNIWHEGQTDVNPDDAYNLGLMVGDGCWTSIDKLSYSTADKELSDSLCSLDPKWIQSKTDLVHWNRNGRQYKKDWANKWELPHQCYAKDKFISPVIMRSSRKVMTAFIQGLFDTDGTLQISTLKGGTSVAVSFCNTSERLIKELHYILLHYGIISTLSSRERKLNAWNTIYELFITGKDVKKFAHQIGFRLSRKQNKLLEGIACQVKDVSSNDIIPNIKDICLDISKKYMNLYKGHSYATYKYLVRKKEITFRCLGLFLERYKNCGDNRIPLLNDLFNNNLYYDKIIKIDDLLEEPTYDLHVPNNHTYIANGFISHNSTIRGQRANVVLCDEFSSVSPEIFETVVRGFASTKSDGTFLNVVKTYKDNVAKTLGNSYGVEFAEGLLEMQEAGQVPTILASNQIIITGTAWYQFNHFYKYFCDYKDIIMGVKSVPGIRQEDYAIIRLPHKAVPPGIMDQTILAQGEAVMDPQIFNMEYNCCLLPGQEIITNKGLKKIEEIEIGDNVLTHKGRFRKVTKRTYRIVDEDVVKFTTDGFKDIFITKNHPIWVGYDNFLPAEYITDYFLLQNNTKFPIIDKEFIPYQGIVYNLEVEEDESYSLPNCTVHNCFPRDSDGFYLASTLNYATCPITSNGQNINFTPLLQTTDPEMRCVMGVDPASENDNFAINIMFYTPTMRGVLYQWTTNRKDFEEKKREGIVSEKITDYNTFCIKQIRSLARRFNVCLIIMDESGGGVSLREGLKDPDKLLDTRDVLILDMDDDNVRGMQGNHMLKMIQFSKAQWRVDAHYGLKKDFIDLKVLFPHYDPAELAIESFVDENMGKMFDTMDDCYYEIEQCKQETTMIRHERTNNGTERWDLPKFVGVDAAQIRKTMKRDRFTSLLLANWGCRLLDDMAIDVRSIDYFGGGIGRFKNTKIEGSPYIGRGANKMRHAQETKLQEPVQKNVQSDGSRRVYY